MLCGEHTLVKNERDSVTLYPLPCKCWTCPECRSGRSARLVAEALAGQPDLFVTLTSRIRDDWTPDYAARRLAWAWRVIRREYIAEHGKGSLPFLAVFEATKRGWPHLHIVARCKWLEQKWLSKRMATLTDSPVVDVRRIKSVRKVAKYVAKYVGKNPERWAGTKRYWRSQDYLKPDPLEADAPVIPYFSWETLDGPWRAVAAAFERQGLSVTYFRNYAVHERGVPP